MKLPAIPTACLAMGVVLLAGCPHSGAPSVALRDLDRGESVDAAGWETSDVHDEAVALEDGPDADAASEATEPDEANEADLAPDLTSPDIPCVPACATECGFECSGTCGRCPAGEYCSHGICQGGLPPDFGRPCDADRDCRADVCLQTVGLWVCTATCASDDCPLGWVCSDEASMGARVCVPTPACESSCKDRQCGPDGCGQQCGTCDSGLACSLDRRCLAPSDGCHLNYDVGTCGGCPCEECVCALDHYCCEQGWDEKCISLCKICGAWCSTCVADCGLKTCGDDGCGGSCGTCVPGTHCWLGACLGGEPVDYGRPCEEDKDCVAGVCVGSTGGGVCSTTCDGSCPLEWTCQAGPERSVCVPPSGCASDCAGRECGPDGCGGQCGGCAAGEVCSKTGECSVPSGGCEAIPYVPGCGGCDCEAAVCGALPHCCLSGWDAICVGSCAEFGSCPQKCQPECGDRRCGPDGCGWFCGWCLPWEKCQEGECLCLPQCEGRSCGSDGCGGSCGDCPTSGAPLICDSDGQCVPQYDGCLANGFPGCLGCECEQCVCDAMPYCCVTFWDQTCADQCRACGTACPGSRN